MSATIKRNEWSNQARKHTDRAKQVGRPTMDEVLPELVDWIQDKLQLVPTDALCDVGMGNGYLLSHFEAVHSLSGVDFSEPMIEVANNTLKGDFRVGFAHDLPFEDATFDKVLAYSIMHYLDNQETAKRVIREMIRVAKSEGIIMIGDVLDNIQEQRIKSNSNKTIESALPSIHRYSSWLFIDLENVKNIAIEEGCSCEIYEQPPWMPFSDYRKDVVICKP